ncbi:MAG: HTH domain-containing protein, partial [bacterium]|nr:HTH domain-containing protein [bacterium]
MLDSKKRLLIQSLSENIYHTSEELGELLGVSSKTARSMVKAVREELEQNGAVVEAKSRKGF